MKTIITIIIISVIFSGCWFYKNNSNFHKNNKFFTIYGNVSEDIKFHFKAMYYAENATVFLVKKGLRRILSEEEGCYFTNNGSYSAPSSYNHPKIEFINFKPEVKKNNNYKNYKIKIPISFSSENNNCQFILHEVKLFVKSKDKKLHTIDIYKYDGDIDYSKYFFDDAKVEKKYNILSKKTYRMDFDNKKEQEKLNREQYKIIHEIRDDLSIELNIVSKK